MDGESGGKWCTCLGFGSESTEATVSLRWNITFASTFAQIRNCTCAPLPCQHLPLLLPTPANYSFTFSWMCYQGISSHYSNQMAKAKGWLMHATTRQKVSSHAAEHCDRPRALWVRWVFVHHVYVLARMASQRLLGLEARNRPVLTVCTCLCGIVFKGESQWAAIKDLWVSTGITIMSI